MPTLALRFEAKVDRSGDHHMWMGSRKADGSGKIDIGGKSVLARRVAWELAAGPLSPGQRIRACSEPSCVRIEHLAVEGDDGGEPSARPRTRAPRGVGSKRQLRPGVWKLTVSAGTYPDGRQRRVSRTVSARNTGTAARLLAEFSAEINVSPPADTRDLSRITLDTAVEMFLTEYLQAEKGREGKTISDYRKLHLHWFSPELGRRRVQDIEQHDMDQLFGRMRVAGLSRSRMNQARSLYAPLFRWAKRRHMTTRDPMLGFQLPTSSAVSRERTPPEVEELCILLSEAVRLIPDVAPVLGLGAVTGMRRGELLAVRRSNVAWDHRQIRVEGSVSETKQVKGTKTRHERAVPIDEESLSMLRRHCEEMDARAAELGAAVDDDTFVFSLDPDCKRPMSPDYVTKRVAIRKDHLGIAEKHPETIALENAALALYRQTPSTRSGITGPAPKGGMSFQRIGEKLGRTERWAAMAVAAAERREQAQAANRGLSFDGSILALRKFTSSELLDAGFNIALVAQRQGHGAQVLIKHYSKGRKSADRRAAEHLGRVVHQR